MISDNHDISGAGFMKSPAFIIRFTLPLLSVLCVLLLGVMAPPAHANPKYASIVMDADSSAILHQRYADKRLHPASLTKIMTLLMLFDALERGEVKMHDRIKISRHAANQVPSKLGLPVGSTIRVKDAIYALVTKSANDVAVAVAEHLEGSESAFALKMTARARVLGMRNTIFRNASGLHDRRQVSTARDMAKMGRAVVFNYPEYYHYFSTRSFTYRGKTYRSHNRLLGKYKGMDGMKTGYVNASGFNLIASAVRDDRRIIAVVFGGRTSNSRNAHMVSLLDRGFKKIKTMPLRVAKAPLPARKPQSAVALARANNTGGFDELMGQGDFDPDERGRLETGLMAIAAHKGEAVSARLSLLGDYAPARGNFKTASLTLNDLNPAPSRAARAPTRAAPVQPVTGAWAIQVGAFKSRTKTDQAIMQAMQKLHSKVIGKTPTIAPLKTGKGWLYRGRITGFTELQARAACNALRDCLPIAPQG